MKKVFAAFALLLLLIAGGASAQVNPYFQVFFPHPDNPGDPYFWQAHVNCTPGQMDSLYVVGKNMNAWVIGAEYQVLYPSPNIMWMADIYTPTTTIGNTAIGISEVWQTPLNGWAPVLLASALYMCNDCPPDTPILVGPNPNTGFIGYSDINTTLYPAIGMVSTFCPLTVPTEDTTWGQVKALFE